MKRLVLWLLVVGLSGIYLAAVWEILHPNVTPAYRAYYIDRTLSDWNPERYPGTPGEGINFAQTGLPEWVDSTSGLSIRQTWGGRWTDASLTQVPSVSFTRPFSGTFCVQFTARPALALIGKTFAVRMADQTETLRVAGPDLAEYRVQFELAQGANKLEFLLPGKLPSEDNSLDSHRPGLGLANLRIVPGSCGIGTVKGKSDGI